MFPVAQPHQLGPTFAYYSITGTKLLTTEPLGVTWKSYPNYSLSAAVQDRGRVSTCQGFILKMALWLSEEQAGPELLIPGVTVALPVVL